MPMPKAFQAAALSGNDHDAIRAIRDFFRVADNAGALEALAQLQLDYDNIVGFCYPSLDRLMIDHSVPGEYRRAVDSGAGEIMVGTADQGARLKMICPPYDQSVELQPWEADELGRILIAIACRVSGEPAPMPADLRK